MYGSAPFAGRLADSRGPRVSLTLSFILLLIGYLGIKAVYDASEDNTEPAGGGTLSTLILFELLSGIGSDTGYSAALNTVAKSFPNKIVSPSSKSATQLRSPLLLLDAASDRDWNYCFWLWIVCFHFFYSRPHHLPGEHVRLLTCSGIRDSRPDGARLVLDSPLPIP